MGKRYIKGERREALELAAEIGAATVARRLGINADTLYGEAAKRSVQRHWRPPSVGGARLSCWRRAGSCGHSWNRPGRTWRSCRRRRFFSPSAGDREAVPQICVHPRPSGPLDDSGHVPGAGDQPAGLLPIASLAGKGGAWVFPSPTGGPISPDSVLHMLHRVLKRAGLPQVRFHDLRHTFATLALQNGVDIKTVSGMLGHFSAGFTLDTYAHVTTAAQREAARTMSGVLSGGRDTNIHPSP